jgi:hypothetical protein
MSLHIHFFEAADKVFAGGKAWFGLSSPARRFSIFCLRIRHSDLRESDQVGTDGAATARGVHPTAEDCAMYEPQLQKMNLTLRLMRTPGFNASGYLPEPFSISGISGISGIRAQSMPGDTWTGPTVHRHFVPVSCCRRVPL